MFFFQFEISLIVLDLSALFEYIFYGTTAIVIFFFSVRTDFRLSNLTSDSDVKSPSLRSKSSEHT